MGFIRDSWDVKEFWDDDRLQAIIGVLLKDSTATILRTSKFSHNLLIWLGPEVHRN